MKPRKKNKFFTFIFSFCPGAAEMYMGFMKNGFSLLAVFMVICGAVISLRADFLLAAAMLVYCFGFFHARNVAGLDDEGFAAFEDKYIWEEFTTSSAFKIKDTTVRLWVSVALILIGISLIWKYLMDIICKYIPDAYWNDIYPIVSNIPSFVFAIAMVVTGVFLIKGKKKELTEGENNG